ncbi:MAG TPA: glycosyl transferase family 2, partial [Paenibacillus sp.]|nr:glycosyl transferase family 2 [Paenibacillus sp.]
MQRIEQIRRSLKAKAFARAEALAIEGLRANRLQPQLWVSLGEALLHRGYVGAARRCFDRAWLLDPEAHWVEEAAARLEGRADGEERVDIEALLRVPNASVAAAIIVKD